MGFHQDFLRILKWNFVHGLYMFGRSYVWNFDHQFWREVDQLIQRGKMVILVKISQSQGWPSELLVNHQFQCVLFIFQVHFDYWIKKIEVWVETCSWRNLKVSNFGKWRLNLKNSYFIHLWSKKWKWNMLGKIRGLSFISFWSHVQIGKESRVMVFGSSCLK